MCNYIRVTIVERHRRDLFRTILHTDCTMLSKPLARAYDSTLRFAHTALVRMSRYVKPHLVPAALTALGMKCGMLSFRGSQLARLISSATSVTKPGTIGQEASFGKNPELQMPKGCFQYVPCWDQLFLSKQGDQQWQRKGREMTRLRHLSKRNLPPGPQRGS